MQKQLLDERNEMVFFDVDFGGELSNGRIVCEVYSHLVPKTAANFLSLASCGFVLSYQHCPFHKIDSFAAYAGDVINKDGTSGDTLQSLHHAHMRIRMHTLIRFEFADFASNRRKHLWSSFCG
jgi:cyclophilin family peptidyl-prolyl cis-trans isomerase